MTFAGIFAAFPRLVMRIFFDLAVALILFFLPLEVLFRLSSWILFMPAEDIISEVAMMILLLSLGSACLAVLVAGVVCGWMGLHSRWTTAKKVDAVYAAIGVGTLALIVCIYMMLLTRWLGQVTGIDISTSAMNAASLLVIIAALFVSVWKYGVLRAGKAIQTHLDKGNKFVAIFVLLSVILVVAKGVALHDDHEIRANPIAAPRKAMPNVILLTIDALAAEDMSLYGYRLQTTPRLDDFGRESYVFDNFFASSNWTTPSVASLISGLYPASSGVSQYGSYFLEPDRDKNLAATLMANGYQTAAVISNVRAHPLFLRISESFSTITEPPLRPAKVDSIYTGFRRYRLKNYWTRNWANDIFQPAFQILGLLQSPSTERMGSLYPPELVFDRTLPLFELMKRPAFIWAHIFPPHDPYRPSPPFKGKFGVFNDKDSEVRAGRYAPAFQPAVDQQRVRYDEFILDTDARVGIFLDQLKAAGRFDDSIIIITADHGESFSKNFFQHGGPYLHQPLVHIPLIVHLPGQHKGKRIPFYAGQVDLLPTVMDLLELPIPTWSDGESLKAAMLEGKPTSKPKFSMNLDRDSRFAPSNKGSIAVMQNGWKLVRYLGSDTQELYDLALDPKETAELASANPEQAIKMRDLIDARFNLVK